MVTSFFEFLIRRRVTLLVLAIALSICAWYPAQRLGFEQTIESLYAPGNPVLVDYTESKRVFGGDEFVFVAYTDPEFFSVAGQTRLQKLAENLAAVPGVQPNSVQSMSKLLAMTESAVLRSQREAILDFARNSLLGKDNETTAVAIRLQDESTSPVPRHQTLSQIRRIAAEHPQKAAVVGESVLVHDMFQFAQDDGEFMGWAASGLLIAVILFFLRDWRAVLLPFVIVQLTILWTKAILQVSHMHLTMVSSVLSSLVTIIGVSTVVYMSLYYQELRRSLDRETAFRQMLSTIGRDMFWVCIATAVGFSAQLFSRLHPVRSFGITMVIGSLFVLVAMMLVLPGGMLLGGGKYISSKPRGDREVSRSLSWITDWVLRHPWRVSIAAGFLLLFAISGLMRLRIDADFTRNFRASSDVVVSLRFMEDRLGGAGMWEVNFPAPQTMERPHLDKVRHLAEELRKIRIGDSAGLTKVVALTDGMDLIPLVKFLIPGPTAQIRLLRTMQPEFVSSLYNPDANRMRIMLRSRQSQSAEEKEQLISQVTQIAASEFPDTKVTGLFVLLTRLIESLLQDQWKDLAIGAVGLIAVMTLAYRSLWLGVVSLIPNVLPIMLLLGGMGWLNLPINMGTAMISSDTMGLTIHDSIFYLSAYLRARRSGLEFRGALDAVQSEVRKPLVYSNIALVLGFLVLTTSHFVPLIYFGVLVSVAIAGGLAVNLLLLPLLLQLGERFSPVAATATQDLSR